MDRRGLKRCPYCQELIKAEAIKCRYCAEWLDVPLESPTARQDEEAPPSPEPGPRKAGRRTGSPAPSGTSRARQDGTRPPQPVRVEPEEEPPDEAADADANVQEDELEPAAARPRPRAGARPAPQERGWGDEAGDEEDNERGDQIGDRDEDGREDEEEDEDQDEEEEEEEDEEDPVIFQGGISRLLLTVPALLFLLWIALGVFLYLRGGPFLSEHLGATAATWLGNIGRFLGVGGALVLGLMLLKRWLGLRKRTFCITPGRIECQDGVLAKSIEGIEMWRIQDLSFAQTTRQALIGLGTITVHSSDKTHPVLKIGPIRRARRVYAELQRAQQAAQRQNGVLRLEN